MALSDRDRVRLQISDENADLFTDDQLDAFLGDYDNNILLASAEACDVLAVRYAPQFDFTAADQKGFKLSQKSKAYADMARALRERAQREAGISVQRFTRRRQFGRFLTPLRDGRIPWEDRCL